MRLQFKQKKKHTERKKYATEDLGWMNESVPYISGSESHLFPDIYIIFAFLRGLSIFLKLQKHHYDIQVQR